MKLNNFTSLDPAERERGVFGLRGASQMDRSIFTEFLENPLEVVEAMEKTAEATPIAEETVGETPPKGPSEITVNAKIRLHQSFFRRSVLASYDHRCCITNNPLRALLRASHIAPWSKFPEERVNPRNGLCLNALHDAAFDQGLITFDESNRLVLSHFIEAATTADTVRQNFLKYEGQEIRLPNKNLPDPAFLAHHRERIFLA